MWADIGRDVFSLVADYLDGRDGARCRRVCKGWKRNVDHSGELCRKIKYHYVRLWDISKLLETFSKNPLKLIPENAAGNQLDNILWFHHGFNPYLMTLVKRHERVPEKFGMEYFVRPLGYDSKWQEQRRRVRDTVPGDIMLVNDFYSSEYDDHEEMLENFIEFKAMMPSLFDWRIIQFPNVREGCQHDGAIGHFHRGWSVQVIFCANGIDNFSHNLRKILKKWKTPDSCYYTKKGVVRMPRPPLKEYTVRDFLQSKNPNNTFF